MLNKRLHYRFILISTTCFCLLLLAGCGGKSSKLSLPEQLDGTPSLDQLKDALNSEFERLGIDPDKKASAPPMGEDNSVFDLSAFVVDPDGLGANPPTQVRLNWTERAIGDYDQNGEVNIGDLTPLGMRFSSTFQYDAPHLHFGLPFWPTGNMTDDGGQARATRQQWEAASTTGGWRGSMATSTAS